jgi:glycerol-3-phosphate dehydrogenase (NAD(P)+)
VTQGAARTTVVGGGSWGTALAVHAARIGLPVSLWVYEADLAARMETARENDVFLPGISLPPGIRVDRDLAACLAGAELVISAVPSHVNRKVWTGAAAHLPPGALVAVVTKGIEEGSLKIPTEVLVEVLGDAVRPRVAALSGPTFAREVGRGLPAAAVVACEDAATAQAVQRALTSDTFRLYTNRDVVGVEVAASLKNVIAIAVGMCDGLELGNNARAALITRGLAEIARLGAALGADPLTFQGLAGVGDLVLTCTGDLSRNRTLGIRLARGETLAAVTGSTPMVAEGVRTTRSALELAAKAGVDLPVTRVVAGILFEGKPPREGVALLMGRAAREERG